MVKSRGQPKEHSIHHYLVVGRHTPTEKNPNPKIYKMRIFANDVVRAKCKFWYFMKKLDKVKKAKKELEESLTYSLMILTVTLSLLTPLRRLLEN